jgi:hypothetical protein
LSNVKIELNEQRAEKLTRVMHDGKFGSYENFLDEAIYLFDNIISFNKNGFKEVVLKDPRADRQKSITLPVCNRLYY